MEAKAEEFEAKILYLDGDKERVLRGRVISIDSNFTTVIQRETGKLFKINNSKINKIEENGGEP